MDGNTCVTMFVWTLWKSNIGAIEGSETYEYLELWDLNDLFAFVFRNGSGNQITLVSQNEPIGWDSLTESFTTCKQACLGCCYPRLLEGGSNLIKKVQLIESETHQKCNSSKVKLIESETHQKCNSSKVQLIESETHRK